MRNMLYLLNVPPSINNYRSLAFLHALLIFVLRIQLRSILLTALFSLHSCQMRTYLDNQPGSTVKIWEDMTTGDKCLCL